MDNEELNEEQLKDLGRKWYIEPPEHFKRKGFATKKEGKEAPTPKAKPRGDLGAFSEKEKKPTQNKIIARTMSKAYLEANWSTVSRKNSKGELEIVPSDVIKVGETFWFNEGGDELSEAKVYEA
jgi:hypothetical protein